MYFITSRDFNGLVREYQYEVNKGLPPVVLANISAIPRIVG